MKKVIFSLLLSLSFAHAECPKMDYQPQNGWRLYPEDLERELWSCKLTSSRDFSKLEFCTGRLTSQMPVGEYIGLAGIEQWKKEYYPNHPMGAHPMWVGLLEDKEGVAEDTQDKLEVIHMPTPDIRAEKKYRYTLKMDKKNGKASYLIERRKHPCVFCGWKDEGLAELKCSQIK